MVQVVSRSTEEHSEAAAGRLEAAEQAIRRVSESGETVVVDERGVEELERVVAARDSVVELGWGRRAAEGE